jgi:hypothetical protein
MCARGMPHIVEKKTLDKGYNFTSNFTSIKGFHNKLWASKMAIVPISRIVNF